MLTADTPVVNVPPRISRDRFVALLAGSPVPIEEARESYEAVAARGIDPLFMLAVFRHESSFGAHGICAKYSTRNPGNTRTPRMMDFPVIQTERGQFVKYPTWTDGFADAAFRLVDPTFVYAQRDLRTIEQIIPVWAPAEDANDPYGYVASVVRLMNTWQEDMTMRDPEAQQPAVRGGFLGYYQWLEERLGKDEALMLIGHPLTEEIQENGLTVQYFERARFEWHPGARPDRFDVLLGRLGAELLDR